MPETRFSQWLSERLAREKLNYTSLAHLVDVSPNTARAWCIGESTPSPEAASAHRRASPADNWRLG